VAHSFSRSAESVSELPLEDAMLIKTYQRAITGSRRAGKKIVKMILERQKAPLHEPRVSTRANYEPTRIGRP
jgi:predicted HicB family RNase H-like nuclease